MELRMVQVTVAKMDHSMDQSNQPWRVAQWGWHWEQPMAGWMVPEMDFWMEPSKGNATKGQCLEKTMEGCSREHQIDSHLEPTMAHALYEPLSLANPCGSAWLWDHSMVQLLVQDHPKTSLQIWADHVDSFAT